MKQSTCETCNGILSIVVLLCIILAQNFWMILAGWIGVLAMIAFGMIANRSIRREAGQLRFRLGPSIREFAAAGRLATRQIAVFLYLCGVVTLAWPPGEMMTRLPGHASVLDQYAGGLLTIGIGITIHAMAAGKPRWVRVGCAGFLVFGILIAIGAFFPPDGVTSLQSAQRLSLGLMFTGLGGLMVYGTMRRAEIREHGLVLGRLYPWESIASWQFVEEGSDCRLKMSPRPEDDELSGKRFSGARFGPWSIQVPVADREEIEKLIVDRIPGESA